MARRSTVLLLTLAALLSCSDTAEDSAASAEPEALELRGEGASAGARGMADAPVPAPTAAQLPSQADATAPALIIRSGSAELEVDSVEAAVDAVMELADELGGYVTNVTMRTGREQRRRADLQLRIPAQRFEAGIAELPLIGKVETVNIAAQDVGEEYVDVEARVANARRLEQRLLDLLARRTGDLDDVLAVERELARIREQIDRYDGRLRYLRSQAAMSTLNVALHEPVPITASFTGEGTIRGAFRSAWRLFITLLSFAIASLGVLVPVAVVGVLAWLVIQRLRYAPEPPVRRPPPR